MLKRTLRRLRKKIVDSCLICGGSNLHCKCFATFSMYEKALLGGAPVGLIEHKISDFGKGQEDNQIINSIKKRWVYIIDNISKFIEVGKHLLVTGGHGEGKTMMSVILMKAAVLDGNHCVYKIFPDLMGIYLSKDNNPYEWLSLMECNALIIDELGMEIRSPAFEKDQVSKSKRFANHVLSRILKSRHDNKLTTIIISNMTKNEILEEYDEVVRSIIQSEDFVHMAHGGKDFRGGK